MAASTRLLALALAAVRVRAQGVGDAPVNTLAYGEVCGAECQQCDATFPRSIMTWQECWAHAYANGGEIGTRGSWENFPGGHPPVPRACSSLCLFSREFRVSARLPDLLSRHRPVALRLAEGVPLTAIMSSGAATLTVPSCLPARPTRSLCRDLCLSAPASHYCPAAHSAASLLYSVHLLHHPSSSSCSSTS